MIDKQIIESAKIIRRDYLRTTSSINEYESDLKNLLSFLQEKIKKLEHIKDTQRVRGNEEHQVDVLVKDVLSELSSIEDEEKKLTNKIDKMNESLSKLRKDEEELYRVIKERYPEMTDDEMKDEIHRHLEK
jgi:chromosome segregation ATPase